MKDFMALESSFLIWISRGKGFLFLFKSKASEEVINQLLLLLIWLATGEVTAFPTKPPVLYYFLFIDSSCRAGGDWSTTYAPSPFYITSKMRSVYLEGYDYSIFDLTTPDRVRIQV